MRYIYEPVTVDSVLRSVERKELETGRTITEVKLNSREWYDFTQNIGMGSLYESIYDNMLSYSLRKRHPMLYVVPYHARLVDYTETILKVTRE